MNSTSSSQPKIRSEVRAVLAQLAVDPRPQAQVPGVRDLVGGRDPRAVRAERVGALGARPLRLAALEVARGHVVGDAVAADLARPRRSRSSARPRSRAGARPRGSTIGPPGGATEPGDLDEHDRDLRLLAAGLGDVLGVVEPDRVHRSRARDRREQRHVGQRPRLRRRSAPIRRRRARRRPRAVGERDDAIVEHLTRDRTVATAACQVASFIVAAAYTAGCRDVADGCRLLRRLPRSPPPCSSPARA